ncbi:hypothetical protein BT69DRAFT_1348209 [Atractiella rhizophila]|nr:hypothetical protein BT69DRAFT_1348209 [Atractiella rhizophila]
MFSNNQFPNAQTAESFTATPTKTYLPGYLSSNSLTSSPFTSNPYQQSDEESSSRMGGTSPSHTLTRTLFGGYQSTRRSDKGPTGLVDEDAPPVVSLMDVDLQNPPMSSHASAHNPHLGRLPMSSSTPLAKTFAPKSTTAPASTSAPRQFSRSSSSLLLFGFAPSFNNTVTAYFQTFGSLTSSPSPIPLPNAILITFDDQSSKEAAVRSAHNGAFVLLPAVGLVGILEPEHTLSILEREKEGGQEVSTPISTEEHNIFALAPKERELRGTPVTVHSGGVFKSNTGGIKVVAKGETSDPNAKLFVNQNSGGGGLLKTASDFIFGF